MPTSLITRMYSALSLALLSQVSAFGLITIHSGSSVQNSGVKVNSDGYLSVTDGEDLDITTIDYNGRLIVGSDAIGVDNDGFLLIGGAKSPLFGQVDTHLVADNNDGFNVCPGEGGKVGLSSAQCPDVINVALRVIEGGSTAPATAATSYGTRTGPSPSGSSTSTAAGGSTAVVEETVTETVCTHETCTGVAPANGAARNAIFGGAAAIAAALL